LASRLTSRSSAAVQSRRAVATISAAQPGSISEGVPPPKKTLTSARGPVSSRLGLQITGDGARQVRLLGLSSVAHDV